MLARAMEQGVRDALAQLGIKEAGLLAGVRGGLIGQPGKLFTEGAAAFRPGGFLSARNVFWPAVSGPGGSKLNWLNRAGTMAMPLQLASAMKSNPESNPEEGRMSRVLGAAGGAAGLAYGYPALGMLGAPIAGALGSRVGRGIGHLLGG